MNPKHKEYIYLAGTVGGVLALVTVVLNFAASKSTMVQGWLNKIKSVTS